MEEYTDRVNQVVKVMAYKRINVDPDVREDIDVLSALIMSRSANTTIKYLLQCYEVYCNVKGIRNFEYLQQSRKMRRLNGKV